MTEHANEGTREQGKALKRRGLIAGAAALVAGMVAKQTAQPVAAVHQPEDLGLGSSFTNLEISGTTILYNGLALPKPGAALQVGVGVSAFNYSAMLAGVDTGSTPTALVGVYGESKATPGSVDISAGVLGNTFAAKNSGASGVFGFGNGNGTFGVLGDGGGSGGVGVQGQTSGTGGTSVGVNGISASGFPIIGKVTGSGSATNLAAGVLGAGTKGPGVQGQSINGHGLVGTTDDGAGHAGLIGNATHTGGIGLMGIAPDYNTPSVGHAGEFYGNVKIYGGSLLAPVVQASVKHPGDGSYRALHSLTTLEGWIEDFGAGTLAADKAEITLDHDFAVLIESGYHVFLTPDGPQHLHVSQKSGSGFTVIATPIGSAGGPKSAVGGGSFSWRVVGKRKDIASERLAKVTPPAAPKTPAAFTIPETPEVKTPTKKP